MIGNDVWIGNGEVIKKGVVIGNGEVIGENEVVKRDVEKYLVVGGVKERIIRKRLRDEVIERMIEI